MGLESIIGSWTPVLEQEFKSDYLVKLGNWVSYMRQSNTIFPASEDVFKALKLCPYGQVRVIIVGQDPYPQEGVADGLAFSYKSGKKQGDKKQSLDVILEEIERDCYEGFHPTFDYQLDYLAKQGVLLLNSVLTVFKNKPGSHVGLGWEKLTSRILLSQIQERSPKCFMIWGAEAKKAINNIATKFEIEFTNHLFLYAPHPAADLYKRDQFGDTKPDYPNTFAGNKHFSQCNEFLNSKGLGAINWLPTYEPFFNKDLTEEPPF